MSRRVLRVVLVVIVGGALAFAGITASGGIVSQASHPGPQPTLTVLPHARLTDLQKVVVGGTGFSSRSLIASAQCNGNATDQNDCDLSTLVETTSDGAGAFTFKRALRRVINVPSSADPIDCAKRKCYLGAANAYRLTEAAIARVTFDPNVPAVRTTLTVSPNKNLADHQLVTVQGKGFTPGVFGLSVQQCVASPSPSCSFAQSFSPKVASNGSFTINHFPLQRLVSAYGPIDIGTTDCADAPGTCVIAAQTYYGAVVKPVAPLTFNPFVPAAVASIQVSPASGLRDQQVVTIVGSGFFPGEQVALAQCGGNGVNAGCDYNNQQALTAGFKGEFLVSFPVHRIFPEYLGAEEAETFDCAAQVGACSIQAYRGLYPAPEPSTVVLNFDHRIPAVQQGGSASPSTGLHDNQQIGVTLTHFTPLRQIEVVQCSAIAKQHADLSFCDFTTSTLASFPAGNGTPTVSMTVHRTIRSGNALANCAAQTGCVLAAFSTSFYGSYYNGFVSATASSSSTTATTAAPSAKKAGPSTGGGPRLAAPVVPGAPVSAPRAAAGSTLTGVTFIPIAFSAAP